MKPGDFDNVVFGQLARQLIPQQLEDLSRREIQPDLCLHGSGEKKDCEGPPLDVLHHFPCHPAVQAICATLPAKLKTRGGGLLPSRGLVEKG